MVLRFGFLKMAMGFSVLLMVGCSSPSDHGLPKTYTIEISSMKFQPASLEVQKGDTVIFLNKDMVSHDVTEEQHKSWSSSVLSPGQSYKLVVTKSADYYCSIHPVMKGKLITN